MADLGEEVKVSGSFGGVEFNNSEIQEEVNASGAFGGVQLENSAEEKIENAGTIRNENLPTKVGFWSKFKAFWLQDIDWNKEIRVELTPGQQKVEDEINEFLHQDITWEKVRDFLFQDVTF